MMPWENPVFWLQLVYCLITLIFLTMTYLEGWHSGEGWDLPRVAGLLLCTVWPVMIALVVLDGLLLGKRRSQASANSS